MTTTSREKIVCSCGHQGFVKLKENDQPFSGLWEAYSLEGFSGKSLTVTNASEMPDDLLAYMQPSCPDCGKTGEVEYAKA